MDSRGSIKDYYSLTKAGLVLGNVITVLAGFALGSQGSIVIPRFLGAAIGLCLVMASGCVFNNYIDRDIDARMERTKERVLVAGRVSRKGAIIFGSILGIAGFLALGFLTNAVATVAALFGFFFYVVMYSLWFKRRTVHGALIGAVSGAMPPVIGYAAATGRIDRAAVILFAIMMVWQMAHFLAIAIRRAGDYAAAGVPVLPVIAGLRATRIQMAVYVFLFMLIAPLLFVFGYAGRIYLAIAIILGIAWFALCLSGLRKTDIQDIRRWAGRVFFFSLIVMMTLFVTIALDALFR